VSCPYFPALLEAEAYDHECEAIRVVETHISWVVLTGQFVYKLKRPVDLGFVDFTSLDARRRDCEKEVAFNRPYCPDVYLDVVPICEDDGSYNARHAGKVIDWAVRMHQFDDARLLTNELDSGRCTHEAIREFGSELAEVHASLPSCRIPDVRTLAGDNITTLERCELPRALEEKAATIAAWTVAEGAELATLMASRDSDLTGKPCHGDLHSGNIVELGGRLRAFDCITFNDELRDSDPINDVAFLFADCCVRNHVGHAYGFLDGYLSASADYEGAKLLPFLAVYRAMVRAKVSAIQGDFDACSTYLDWCMARIRSRKGTLYLMCGVSGSGKSWLARRIAPELPALRLATDVWRQRVETGTSDRYSTSQIANVYTSLLPITMKLLESGENVIVDATFMRRELRTPFLQAAADRGIQAHVIACHAAEETLTQRIAGRQNDASEATVDVMRAQLEIFERPGKDEGVIDFDSDREDVSKLITRLNKGFPE
jgi:aminoglycoside phosphotransferase family enzyme/predicted kinase